MDASFHTLPEVKEEIRTHGTYLMHSVPHSPGLNLIVKFFWMQGNAEVQ